MLSKSYMKFMLTSIPLNIVVIMNPLEKYYGKFRGTYSRDDRDFCNMVSNKKFHCLLPINVTFDSFKTQKKKNPGVNVRYVIDDCSI